MFLSSLNDWLNFIVGSALFLLKIVAPPILFALILQFFSQSIRRSCGNLLGERAFIYLTAPGVVVHELSHAFFCLLFGHKIVTMKLFSPENDGTLGYVEHAWNSKNLWHRIGNFFIGTGPIWGGIVVLLLLNYCLLSITPAAFGTNLMSALEAFFRIFSHAGIWKKWQTWLWFYAAFAISTHITLSLSDLKGAISGLGSIILLLLLLHVGLTFFHEAPNELLQWCMRLQNSLAGIAVVFIVFFAVLASLFFILARWKNKINK